MQIFVNDKTMEVEDGLTAAGLIERLGLADKRLAMEINLSIIPRSALAEHRLQPGDRIEIVHAIGGG
ncbi:MAG: sulfur carrier protein ThiS [Candidatus Competibacteraceae bacterium]|nr:sulfur carrier protein ThiS [Candidatus Competibacteraceae bacterium]